MYIWAELWEKPFRWWHW